MAQSFIRIAAFVIFVSGSLSVFQALAEDGAAPRFFTTLNDVPLMDGLEELIDQAVVFDMAEGRIVESSAVTDDFGIRAIRDFYNATLPQLGWQKVSEGAFVRSGEVLEMRVQEEEGYNTVHFMISPR